MLYKLPTTLFICNKKKWSFSQDQVNNVLSKKEIINLKNINNNLSIEEIKKNYLPLSNFLNFYICSNIKQHNFLQNFLKDKRVRNIPYIIGITGSVASGKSTTAKILQILLNKWAKRHIAELVTTDGFLYSNQILKTKQIIQKKGFPQSYNIHNLIDFMIKLKSGSPILTVPIYSHITYDILHNIKQIIYTPKILILEGLNILQTHNNHYHSYSQFLISDFIDFSIYIDAPEFLLREWYIRRFLKFCYTTFSYPESYFYRYSRLSHKKLIAIAAATWDNINKLNLNNYILPSKNHADLILNKGFNHKIDSILLKDTTHQIL